MEFCEGAGGELEGNWGGGGLGGGGEEEEGEGDGGGEEDAAGKEKEDQEKVFGEGFRTGIEVVCVR